MYVYVVILIHLPYFVRMRAAARRPACPVPAAPVPAAPVQTVPNQPFEDRVEEIIYEHAMVSARI